MIHVRSKLHEAIVQRFMSYQQCTRFRTTLDLIADISGTDQAIDRRKTAL